MKSSYQLLRYKKLIVVIGMCLLGTSVLGQQKLDGNLVAASKVNLAPATRLLGEPAAPVKLDTVECLFHQMINNTRPLLTWRRGYIVLENEKLRVADQLYDKVQASSLTGLIQNQFLASNKKKPITKKVVQVVLLQ